MNTNILTLRVTRRAIGVAAIRSGEASLLDGRFLSGPADRAIPAAVRYVTRLLALANPGTVVLDAPTGDPSTLVTRLTHDIEAIVREQGRTLLRLERHDILTAFGVTRVVDRRQLRELVAILWPDMAHVVSKVRPFVADAAAAALYGETRLALTPPRV